MKAWIVGGNLHCKDLGIPAYNHNSVPVINRILYNRGRSYVRIAMFMKGPALISSAYVFMNETVIKNVLQQDTNTDGNTLLTSNFCGVIWNPNARKWHARIRIGGKNEYLGLYTGEHEAARAFDRAALRHRGLCTKINFTLSDYTNKVGELVDDSKQDEATTRGSKPLASSFRDVSCPPVSKL